MTKPRSSPVTEQLTARQKAAIREMAELERQYGRTFLLNTLHQVRFEYRALERVAKGYDS
jgi:hypothetical protein